MGKKVRSKKVTAGPKAKPAEAKPGHNMKVDRKLTKETFDKLDALHKEKATDAASYASRIGNVYEKAANDLGVKQKALKEAYDEHRFEQKKLKRRSEMTPEQQQDIDRLILAAASYKTSPLFIAAQEREQRQEIAKDVAEKSTEASAES